MYDGRGSTPELELGPRARVPFAAPLSAVDRIAVRRWDDGLEVTAAKTVDHEDPYMPAHFPGFTIYPGAFVAETVLQAVRLARPAGERHLPTIATVRHLRLLAPLLGHDTLSCSVTVTPCEAPDLHKVVADVRTGDGRPAAWLDCEMRFGAGGPGTL
jgi:3-hydroxyacyl-[acyl-carrier-protein] dehydratase